MKPTKYKPDLTFSDVAQLAAEHGAKSLAALGREFYDMTRCGVSTRFISLQAGETVFHHYSDDDHRLTREMPANQWPIRACIGVEISTIVEGSDAEFSADPLYFPFTDEELAAALDYLQFCADEHCGEMEAESEVEL